MPFGFFTTFAWPIVKACFLALFVSFAVGLIPIIVKLLSDMTGIDTFIQGIVIFRIFSARFIERLLQSADLQVVNLYPGFWASAGYFVLATVLGYACFFAFAALGVTLSRNQYPRDDTPSFFLGMALMPILGILPLFMYANHVALPIQQATR